MSVEVGVAIIGMAGRFPGSASVDQFWRNLCNKVTSISFFEDRELDPSIDTALINKDYIKARGIIEDCDKFDAAFFNIPPSQAEVWDPQQRVFLEIAWAALENAGYYPGGVTGPIGVFAGKSESTYRRNIESHFRTKKQFDPFQVMLGNEKDYLPTSISYYLDLKGPSVNVQTACSTSLTAAAYAFDSLMTFQCDMALAGGITIICPQESGYYWMDGSIRSKDGHCRPFDSMAQGTVFSNGGGIIVLKRLEDALRDNDTIYAVMKGTGINNDGANKASFAAPSVNGQVEVIAMAMANAEVNPETVTYIETHGTGTPIGDPIEIEALTQAFQSGTSATNFCAIGSLKGNVGHLDAAAGVAGLIKASLALKNKIIPPSNNFQKANPEIDFENSPFYVNTRLRHWKEGSAPRRAGVTSLGVGGTNVHVILEEAPVLKAGTDNLKPSRLLVFSAKTRSALEKRVAQFSDHITTASDINLADTAYTLGVGRAQFAHRCFFVCKGHEDLAKSLQAKISRNVHALEKEKQGRSVVFLFPGQGAQYAGMGKELYFHEPAFKTVFDQCAGYLLPIIGIDLRELIYAETADSKDFDHPLYQTVYSQAALFATEYALAKLWMSWGVQPRAMIGHSIGEYVAACIAGVFSLEDALWLVSQRGRLMQAQKSGAMMSVALPADEVRAMIVGMELSIAAVNAPSMCVVSGSVDKVDHFYKTMLEKYKDVNTRMLHTSHAFHSSMMAPAADLFLETLNDIKLNDPQIPFVSNVTGTWITEAQTKNPEYWANHLRQTVLFSDGVATLLENDDQVFMEIGPGNTLSTCVAAHLCSGSISPFASLRHARGTQPDLSFIYTTLGKIWLTGIPVDWQAFYQHEKRYRIPLPTYPFERKRHWVDVPVAKPAQAYDSGQYHRKEKGGVLKVLKPVPVSVVQATQNKEHIAAVSQSPRDNRTVITKIWADLLGIEKINPSDNFFDLGGQSLLASQMIVRLREHFLSDIPLHVAFDHPTIEELVVCLEKKGIFGKADDKRVTIFKTPNTQGALSPLQHRLWCIHQFDPLCTTQNIARMVKITPLDMTLLQKVLDEFVAKHENLRTSVYSHDGVPYKTIAENQSISINVLEKENTQCFSDADIYQWMQKEAQQPFDFKKGPLFRAYLCKTGENEHLLLMIFHQIITDGWPIEEGLTDLLKMYELYFSLNINVLPNQRQKNKKSIWTIL